MGSEKIQPVNIGRDFPYPAESVFDAWLRPDVMQLWMFADSPNNILSIDVDDSVGGKFTIRTENGNGEQIDHYGKYVWIDRPRELIFTLEVPRHFPGITYVTVKIAATPAGCQLQLTQTGIPREVTETNWRDKFDRLEAVLNS